MLNHRNGICAIEGCGRNTWSRGWCHKHYQRFRKHGDTSKIGSKRTHGAKGTPEYNTWKGMKFRCSNPAAKGYRYYGGRGIKVCERWQHSFENFLSDMGIRPSPGHSIDRIDVNGDYSPENCRWATRLEQMANRTDSRFVVLNGERMILQEAARRTKLDPNYIRSRLTSDGQVRMTPPRRRQRRQLSADEISLILRERAAGATKDQLASAHGISSRYIDEIISPIQRKGERA